MKKILNSLKSKTIGTGLIVTLIPQIMEIASPEKLEQIGVTNPNVLSIIGVVMVLLRMVTNKPLSAK